MSVDPGLTGTGWAVWSGKDYEEWQATVPPLAVGVLTVPPSKGDFVLRAGIYSELIKKQLTLWRIKVLYCEYPIYFNDAGGQMGMETGDIPKLIFLTGCIAEVCRQAEVKFVPVTVREWKGMVKKDMMERRIRRTLSEMVCERLNITDHAWDAVGIGLKMKEVHK